jgi:hypothetical protein
MQGLSVPWPQEKGESLPRVKPAILVMFNWIQRGLPLVETYLHSKALFLTLRVG